MKKFVFKHKTGKMYKDKRGYIYSVIDDDLSKKILPKKLRFKHTKINFCLS